MSRTKGAKDVTPSARKRPDLARRNIEANPAPLAGTAGERTVLVSGRVSAPVAEHLISMGPALNDGERIEKAIRRVIDTDTAPAENIF